MREVPSEDEERHLPAQQKHHHHLSQIKSDGIPMLFLQRSSLDRTPRMSGFRISMLLLTAMAIDESVGQLQPHHSHPLNGRDGLSSD